VNPSVPRPSADLIVQSVRQARLDFITALSSGVAELVELGNWRAAIRLVVLEGRIGEAELARSLEVMQSTVTLWMNGQTTPQAASVPYMVQRIQELLLA
jgi:hypothetical protein